MDTEICIVTLCTPELEMDAKALNARISKVEEMLRNGVAIKEKTPEPIVVQAQPEVTVTTQDCQITDPPIKKEAPVGFWTDLVASLQDTLKPPLMGFITAMPDSPIKGVLDDTVLTLNCFNKFAADMVNKPEILTEIEQKATAILGWQVHIKVVDTSAAPAQNQMMQQLLRFGKEHADIVSIKE